MNLKSLTEGMRALVYKAYFVEELAHSSPDEEERKRSSLRLELLTPLVKAYCSDRIFEMGREGIQIMGGYGYCSEYPVEQYTRDCKILSIWDGTNYIQSADLVGRKLSMADGKAFGDWIEEVQKFIENNMDGEIIADETELLKDALDVVLSMSNKYRLYLKEGKFNNVALTSIKFLDCCAEVAIGHLLLEQALIAAAKLKELTPEDYDSRFYRSKIATARYYLRNFVPNVYSRKRSLILKIPLRWILQRKSCSRKK